jgi:hypothetical protein
MSLIRAKTYLFGFGGLLYEIVQGNDDFVYPLVVFFNVKHEKFPEIPYLFV